MDRSIGETILNQESEGANHPLDSLFHPQTVALVGATEKVGSVGRTILRNLVTNPFGGTVYPVNPKRSSVWGIKAYPSIGAIPERVDLAVVVTPAPSILGSSMSVFRPMSKTPLSSPPVSRNWDPKGPNWNRISWFAPGRGISVSSAPTASV